MCSGASLRACLLGLPWDYELFDRDPDRELVADDVRASMSIPLYFKPPSCATNEQAKSRRSWTAVCCRAFLLRSSIAPIPSIHAGPPLQSRSSRRCPVQTPRSSRRSRCQRCHRFASSNTSSRRHSSATTRPTSSGHACPGGTIDVDTRSIGLTEFNANKRTRDNIIEKGRQAADQFLAGWTGTPIRRNAVVLNNTDNARQELFLFLSQPADNDLRSIMPRDEVAARAAMYRPASVSSVDGRLLFAAVDVLDHRVEFASGSSSTIRCLLSPPVVPIRT